MAMNKQLLGIAKKTVRLESKEQFDEEVKEEYNRLVYGSQIIKADPTTAIKLKALYKKSLKVIRRHWSDFNIFFVQEKLKGWAKTGKHHPKEFIGIQKYIARRLAHQEKYGR